MKNVDKIKMKSEILATAFLGLAVRSIISLYSYSGFDSPPMHGDYEAQRHWQEITVNLGVGEWYTNSSSNDLMYWGLDYPPLTAYHSYFLGRIGKAIDPRFVELHESRGFQSEEHKRFMRATVVAADVLIYLPAILFLVFSIDKTFQSNDCLFLFTLIATYPGQILIDNGHFQYNNISLGLAAVAVGAILRKRLYTASFFFTLALNYKQMELYHSLPFFAYLLGECVSQKSSFVNMNLTKSAIAAVTILCIVVGQVTCQSKDETTTTKPESPKILDISYMEIDDLPETVLHGPRDLETLIAAGNLFKQLPKALKYATNLTSLVLNENPIESLVGDNIFPPLTKLNHLSMTFMAMLYKIGPGALSELQSLKELILSDNKFLNEIDEEALSKNVTGGQYLDYPPLEKVYLNNCNITTLPKPLLVRWDKLKALDLRFNPWSCDTSNDYLINVLIGQVNKTTEVLAKNVQCASPDTLKGVEILRVADEHLVESSSGSLVWVGLLVVLLIAVPTLLGAYVMKRRGCFGVFRRHDSVADRALYNRTSFNEDFHI
ncbi:hypothetical protein M5D96_003761 [Drosophila gunungcola]|uniref:Alpha-1,3-glucosyltransferase n=1 Tax=Drosophila gunungcola TaxID=103775 RepID=A0A9P9YT82_9MUSC|nr:hypothetical protein M5D96_003761 [Drosophila gunungcola]